MGVPKHRRSKSRRDMRRMHIFIKQPNLILCLKCGKSVLPHTVCPYCGYYRQKEEINILAKLEKKERKKREKEMKAKEEAEKGIKKERPLSWKELSRK